MSPVQKVITVVIIAVLIVLGVNYILVSAQYTSTDDAYLTNDILQISPQVSGTVKQVLVSDNQVVKKGDRLVVLDDAPYVEAVAQKQADLDAAIAQAHGAGINVDLTKETGNAQQLQGEGLLGQAESGIGIAKADLERSEAAVQTAMAMAKSADASSGAAKAALDGAMANKRRNIDAVGSADASLKAAQATVRASRAISDKAAEDAKRADVLVAKGAISRQAYDAAVSASLAAQAQLENSEALVNQKQEDLNGARRQLEASDAMIEQAKSQLQASKASASAAHVGITQAKTQQTVALEVVGQSQSRHEQAQGQLNQAKTSPRQVAVSRSAAEQAKAKVEQAKAALDAAILQLSYTRIYAPADGRVNKKTVEVGALVEPGTPLFAIVPDNNVWVTANFKETQLRGMRTNQSAEIHVDAVDGRDYRGHIDSISSATGSTFALLPPDNATGNFVKVVQRVPVKIVLDNDQPNLDKLRAGMSVIAIVKVK